MFNFLKNLFKGKQSTEVTLKKRTPESKRVHREKLKARKIRRMSSKQQLRYERENYGVTHYRPRKKQYNRAQDATKTWYYQEVLSKKDNCERR